jgi:polypeptide N-acetylgalactosaminyltransferase
MQIQSVANPNLCIDTLGADREQQIGVYKCKSDDLEHPEWRQMFTLRQFRDIRTDDHDTTCLDFNHNKILIYICKFKQENQYFRYDLDTRQIFCGPVRDQMCIDFDMKTKLLIYTKCDSSKVTQKWNWGFVNETMLGDWINSGKPILDQQEVLDLKRLG